MTNHLKSSLLAATAMLAAGTAQAQVVAPASELRGTGASSVQDIFPREANCVGGFKYAADPVTGTITATNSYTLNADSTVSARRLPNGTFNGTPAYDCATDSVQPNISVRYIGVGSGTGRAQFLSTDFQTTYGAAAAPNATIFGSTVKNVVDASGNITTPGWAHTHFALSDSPLKSTERDAFNARPGVGKIIQFPLYVLPVALAYSPTYASNTATGFTYQFNIAVPATDNGVATGGLRLSKVAYCGIFNGTIVNWNDAKIAATNYATIDKKTKKPVLVPLYDPARDTASRWNTEGAPIRLIGRLDKSGTTDIFTRHLAAACGTVGNRYAQAAESLPFDSTSAIDLTAFRPDTNYKPGVAASNFAGTTQSLTGIVYNGSAGFVIGTGGAAEGISTTPGTAINGSGLFLVAAGSGNVRDAVATTSVAGSTINVGPLKFNGKIGYISADNVLPAATTGGLHSAALETGASVNLTADATFASGFKVAGKKPVWSMPTAANATAAFGKTILAPESDAKGNYKADKTGAVSRSNALDWYNVLYAGGIKDHLNNPTLGYPMTGTTQLITGTCFASAADRNALTTMVLTILGKNVKKSAGADVSANLFPGLKAPEQGVRAQAGIAPLPAGWATAIANTFFGTDAKMKLNGKQPLFIQNGMATTLPLETAGVALHKAPTKQSAKTITGYTVAGPNPTVTYTTSAGKPPVNTTATIFSGCVDGQGL